MRQPWLLSSRFAWSVPNASAKIPTQGNRESAVSANRGPTRSYSAVARGMAVAA